jgi:hypothetical protein
MERPPHSAAQWESFVEKQIREGMARGDFDNLPGKGKPLAGLDGTRDDDWWIKRKLKEERLSYLPPTLALRKDVEAARARIAAATSEAAVRAEVDAINVRIREVNSRSVDGPPSTQMPLDVETIVARWRADSSA